MIHALLPVAMLTGPATCFCLAFMPEAAWSPIDRLVYYVLFPSLLVTELARPSCRASRWRAWRWSSW